MAQIKKKALKQGQTIVFIDESGLSERPHTCRTWAPRGQTPILRHRFNWKRLSAIAGVTWKDLYFRLYPGSIRAKQVIHFLSQLKRMIKGKLLIIWDGLPAHRSRTVTQWISAQSDRIQVERFPAYAPELNPVEFLWGYWKQHILANFCARTFWELDYFARRALRRVQGKKQTLITAFWKQADLL